MKFKTVKKDFVRKVEELLASNFETPAEGLTALLSTYVVLGQKYEQPGQFKNVLIFGMRYLSSISHIKAPQDETSETSEASGKVDEVTSTGDPELDKLCDVISILALIRAGGDKDKALASIEQVVTKMHQQEEAPEQAGANAE